MKNKVALFYNPVAGGGKFKLRLDDVFHQLQKCGLQAVPWRITPDQSLDGPMLSINPDEYHSVAVAGGDGTVNIVVNAMARNQIDIPLAIIPAGTCNDLAAYLGIPSDLKKCCDLIAKGSAKPIDLGSVNNRYFVNVAAAGFLTNTAHEADYYLKNVLGKLAYYMKGIEKIPQMKSLQIELNVDGQSTQFEAILFLVLNGGVAGGFLGLSPETRIDDGRLDFLAIKSMPLPKLAQVFYYLKKDSCLLKDSTIRFSGEKFTIKALPQVTTDLDGEKGPDLPWHISVHPRAIHCYSVT
ncbi:MAG: diacylglycerol/lipid kinase family protein [Syntrophomonadaceae bacterium]|jgi:diacylglycerol kinase (ATP)